MPAPGTLARSILAAAPACVGALRYVLVERSATLRAQHERGLPIVLPMHAFAVGHEPEEDDGNGPPPVVPDGPVAVSLEAMPPPETAHVVVANELLDNLPVRLFERASEDWLEVGVGADLDEVLLPADPAIATRLGDDPPVGARVAWQAAAVQWLRDALDVAPRVVVFDYMTTTAEMANRPWTDWLRTYRGHERGRDPLADIGLQDITCEVALDQLATVRVPVNVGDQRTFLAEHGIDALVEEGRDAWARGAAQGGLDALRGRSRVREAEALTDISGLGGFTVAEWAR